MSQASRTNITLEMFAAAFAELAEFLPTYDAVMERRDAEIARRSGIPSHWSFRTEDETDAHLKAMRIVDKEVGFAEVSKRRNELELPLDRMARLIIDAPHMMLPILH
jgi:hypothetical protein